MYKGKVAAILWTVFTLIVAMIGFMGYASGESYMTFYGIRLSLVAFTLLIIVFLISDFFSIVKAFRTNKSQQQNQYQNYHNINNTYTNTNNINTNYMNSNNMNTNGINTNYINASINTANSNWNNSSSNPYFDNSNTALNSNYNNASPNMELLPAPCTINLSRLSSVSGSLVPCTVYHNYRPIGELKNGQTIVFGTNDKYNNIMISYKTGQSTETFYFIAAPGENLWIDFKYTKKKLYFRGQ